MQAGSFAARLVGWRRSCAGRVLSLLGVSCWTALCGGAEPLLPGDTVRGWRVFSERQCIRCHSIWGLGGEAAPDLGRTGREHFTAAQIARALWNHVPKMRSYMDQQAVEYPALTPQEMSDLFSLLHFVGQLDEPGDPEEGQRLLGEKGCMRCHASGPPAAAARAPDLTRWGSSANSILWAQKIWEHSPRMREAMRAAGIQWPQLEELDLVNIMAHVRTLSQSQPEEYIEPGSARRGEELFSSHGCRGCHGREGPGEDLATTPLPRTLAGLASRLWNHTPEMLESMRSREVERLSLTPQEMADIIAYIQALRFVDPGGDATRGRKVFEEHRCAHCHSEEEVAGAGEPSLEKLARATTPVRFAQALWNHGVAMMDRLAEEGMTWPLLGHQQVVDLIAYLRTVEHMEATRAREAGGGPGRLEPLGAEIRPPPLRPGASCVTSSCHARLVAGPAVHTPAAQEDCEACHLPEDPEAHRFRLADQSSELCYRCHERKEPERDPGPVAVAICTACHDPHSAENPFGPGFTGSEVCFAEMIRGTTLSGAAASAVGLALPAPAPGRGPGGTAERPPAAIPPPEREAVGPPLVAPVEPRALSGTAERPAAVTESCVTGNCHAAVVAGARVHRPVAQEQCEACHALADESQHRFQLAAKGSALCIQCHDDYRQGRFVHGPVGLDLCDPCHEPHGGPHPFLLRAAGNELCFLCHSEMAAHVREARVQHQVVAEQGCSACHDPHRAELPYQLRKGSPELCFECHRPVEQAVAAAVVRHGPVLAGRGCSNCHNPHGSDVDKILASSEKDLCLDCHDEPMETPGGPIIDMKSWVESHPERHGPVEQGNCTGCHLPHGSENFRILRHAFPREFYRPFSLETYALCFACHEETVVLEERTTTLTGFRNGDKNLHYVHVHQEKGRTCRACHEVHAGTQPKRMRDFVPFGKWKYPVNFQETEHGGRCRPGCHVPRAYDREREIVQE